MEKESAKKRRQPKRFDVERGGDICPRLRRQPYVCRHGQNRLAAAATARAQRQRRSCCCRHPSAIPAVERYLWPTSAEPTFSFASRCRAMYMSALKHNNEPLPSRATAPRNPPRCRRHARSPATLPAAAAGCCRAAVCCQLILRGCCLSASHAPAVRATPAERRRQLSPVQRRLNGRGVQRCRCSAVLRSVALFVAAVSFAGHYYQLLLSLPSLLLISSTLPHICFYLPHTAAFSPHYSLFSRYAAASSHIGHLPATISTSPIWSLSSLLLLLPALFEGLPLLPRLFH